MPHDLFGQVSTLDDGQRSDLDFYETPAWATYSLLHFHPAIRRARVLEPCSGRNAIANVLAKYGCTVHTNDVDQHQPAEEHEDARFDEYWLDAPGVEWVITNTPFNVAFEIVQRAKAHATVGVAFLLRKTFLEPTIERGPWLNLNPPSRVIGLPRHSFRGSGDDSVSCDWFIWERQPDKSLRPFEIDHLAKSRRTD